MEELASKLNISRVQLYRKVKAVLGIGVGDYINNFRLEKAKELNAIPFDIPEVEFTHYNEECTFDYIIKKYLVSLEYSLVIFECV